MTLSDMLSGIELASVLYPVAVIAAGALATVLSRAF